MKISFNDLEKIRKDPKALNTKGIFNGRYSKFRRWQDAISRYHIDDNQVLAEKHPEGSFDNMADNASNRRDLKKYLEHINEYVTDYKSLDSEEIEFRKVMSFDTILNHRLSGQIPRLDINIAEDGYSIYFFSKDIFDWESELRFPILQDFIAQDFGCDSDFVKVGVYILNNAAHYNTSFTKIEIDEAKKELDYVITEFDKVSK